MTESRFRSAATDVVVGVDGSSSSFAAVDVAVTEAAMRKLPLRIVHVCAGGPLDRQAPEMLRVALHRASAASDEVAVTSQALVGDPGAVLVRRSATADLVVVGRRGRGGFAGLLVGSVAEKLAAHAGCPVVVACGECGSAGAVVVGVDGSDAGRAAVGFAFEEADLRRSPLLAIHAASGPPVTGPGGVLRDDLQHEEARVTGLVADAVDEWHERHPDVPVRHTVRWAPAAGSLIEASRGAQLVVVGVRGTSGLVGARLGAVSHALLHHAGCPVAVVHPVR
jgi:nucleotide-binding universal stress UspA family protein